MQGGEKRGREEDDGDVKTPKRKRVRVLEPKKPKKPVKTDSDRQVELEARIRELEDKLAAKMDLKTPKKKKKAREPKRKEKETVETPKAVFKNRYGEDVQLLRWPHVHKLSPDAHKARLQEAVELLVENKIKITTKNIKKLGIGQYTLTM
jgi:hypothetical protein